MNAIMSLTGGRAPHRKISAGLAKDLIGLAKLAVLAFQRLQSLGDIRRNA
jgi:hypothetical protein